MSLCNICPRNCNADRRMGQRGVCNVSGSNIFVARYALHMWEEECISGKEGSGTIFFSGCNLRCVYCQNSRISRGEKGSAVTVEEFADICISLMKQGANNINLVTPTHYVPEIIRGIQTARKLGMNLPIVYNTSGYEKVETLKQLEGIVDIYLTDFKYMYGETGRRYSGAENYPLVAKNALKEMVRQVPDCIFDTAGMMKKGVIVRHLLLPGHVNEGKKIVDYLHENYGNQLFISLMNQYTPMNGLEKYPEINRKVTKREYSKLIDHAISIGVENGFIQEGNTADESFIPDF